MALEMPSGCWMEETKARAGLIHSEWEYILIQSLEKKAALESVAGILSFVGR